MQNGPDTPKTAPLNLSATSYFEGFAPLYADFSARGFFGDAAKAFNALSAHCHGYSKILDVGIGSGESARPFAAAGHEITGIDGAAAMLGHCEQSGIAPRERLHLVNIANARFPLPDDSFDVTICNQTLYFLQDPTHALQEMVRVTRSGGLLAFNFRAAPEDRIIAHTNNVTGYDKSFTPSQVQTYQHPPSMIHSFARQTGLTPLAPPQRYNAYYTLKGEAIDFDLCIFAAP